MTDGSSDNTINMCKEILKDIPEHIIQNDKSLFVSEVELRKNIIKILKIGSLRG